MQELKKQAELLLINYCRACYPEFPKGKLEKAESPDFVLRRGHGKKLGIELVQLLPEWPLISLEKRVESAFRFELIQTVKDLFEHSSALKLYAKFSFSNSENIPPERLLLVSVGLAKLIRTAVTSRKPASFYYQHFSANALPQGVGELLLIHHPEMSDSIWEEANHMGVPENVVSDLDRIIARKDEKLQLYQKRQLDEYWLLITIDRLQNTHRSHVGNQISNQSFHSKFKRVLLFDLMKSKVHELKMPSSD